MGSDRKVFATWQESGIEIPYGASGEIRVICPDCSGDRKKRNVRCLGVDVDQGIFNCNHCGFHGIVTEANKDRDWRSSKVQPKPRQEIKPPTITVFDDKFAYSKEAERALDAFLASRGLSRESAEFAGVMATTNWFGELHDGDGASDLAAAFVYSRKGDRVGTKFRALTKGKAFAQPKGGSQVLYNLEACQGAREVIITEGEIDALTFIEAGMIAVASVPGGAPPVGSENPQALSYMMEPLAIEVFEQAESIILAVDNDGPGLTLRKLLAAHLGEERCWILDYPDDCKDINDVLVKFGVDKVSEITAEAKPYPIVGIKTVEEIIEGVRDYYHRGNPEGFRTGAWPSLDAIYRPWGGTLNVWTGVPSSGKSHFLNALAMHYANHMGIAVGICSPEMQPIEFHFSRLASALIGKPFFADESGRDFRSRMTEDELEYTARWLQPRVGFVIPEKPTLAAILSAANALKRRLNIRMLIIDPYTELEHERPPHLTESEYTAIFCTILRNWARRMDVQVHLVAHPTKLRKAADGSMPVPTPYDISGSAAWFNKPDYNIAVDRDKEDPNRPVAIHIQKVRFPGSGELGIAEFNFDPGTGQYHDAGVAHDGGPFAARILVSQRMIGGEAFGAEED